MFVVAAGHTVKFFKRHYTISIIINDACFSIIFMLTTILGEKFSAASRVLLLVIIFAA